MQIYVGHTHCLKDKHGNLPQGMYVRTYISDMVIADQHWKHHLSNLESILSLCHEKKISLKLKKFAILDLIILDIE